VTTVAAFDADSYIISIHTFLTEGDSKTKQFTSTSRSIFKHNNQIPLYLKKLFPKSIPFRTNLFIFLGANLPDFLCSLHIRTKKIKGSFISSKN